MSRTPSSLPTALAGAALVISIATGATVAFERVSDWTLIRGEGQQTTSPQSPFETDALTRILFPRLRKSDGPHDNHMISLTYNWDWDANTGWSRPDLNAPSVALTLESWFYGLAELNFDMRPPRNVTDWPGGRLMGFAARHDGTYATLSLGGRMFNPSGAGIKLTGGISTSPLVLLDEGPNPPSTILQIIRGDKVPSLAIRGGATPSLAFGLSGAPADQAGAGVLSFAGPLRDEPLINVRGSGAGSTLLTSNPSGSRDATTFRMTTDGGLEWWDGGNEPTASLSAQGKALVVGDGIAASSLRVGVRGTEVRRIQILHAELEPAEIWAHGMAEQVFRIPGIGQDAIIVLNGPAQPDGIGIAGVRTSGDGAIAVTFVNASAEPKRASAGRYLVLAIAADEGSS
jgi:hypothetical protein